MLSVNSHISMLDTFNIAFFVIEHFFYVCWSSGARFNKHSLRTILP